MIVRQLTKAEVKLTIGRLAQSPRALWGAFALVHLLLGLLNLYGIGYPLGDVTSVYRYWVDQALVGNYWVGIDAEWVYPIVAILPMLAAQLAYPVVAEIPGLLSATDGPALYANSWLLLVFLLNVVAFGVLTGWGRRPDRLRIGWWWIGFLLALGPIVLGRIDSVSVPVALVGGLYIATRPRLATVVLTIAAWIKVWPGAIVIAMVIATKRRWRVLVTAVATSAAITAIAMSFGSGLNVFSFVSQQSGRGLQIEAPVTTIWMWRAAFDPSVANVYYDTTMLTWQVQGAGVLAASALMTPLLLLAVAGISIVGVRAVRRGASANAIIPPLVLAFLTGMIAFQKVGSPQFISWLAVPVLLGMVAHQANLGPSFRTPAKLVLVIAVTTQLIYPYLYGLILALFPPMLVVLTIRNVLLFVLLGWAIRAISRTPGWTPLGAWDESSARLSSQWPVARARATVDEDVPAT